MKKGKSAATAEKNRSRGDGCQIYVHDLTIAVSLSNLRTQSISLIVNTPLLQRIQSAFLSSSKPSQSIIHPASQIPSTVHPYLSSASVCPSATDPQTTTQSQIQQPNLISQSIRRRAAPETAGAATRPLNTTSCVAPSSTQDGLHLYNALDDRQQYASSRSQLDVLTAAH